MNHSYQLYSHAAVCVSFAALLLTVRKRSKQQPKKKRMYKTIEVTEEHYHGVLEMAKHTYGGHDWIGNEFHNWFKLGCKVLGMECEETKALAALLVTRPLPLDRIGSVEALRVHPDHRGQGLAHRIQKEMIEAVKKCKDSMNIGKLRYTLYDGNTASYRVAEKSGMETKFSWPFVMVVEDEEIDAALEDYLSNRFGKGAIRQFHVDVQRAYHKLHSSHPRTVSKFVTTSPEVIVSKLRDDFDVGLLYQDWKPYDPTMHNIQHLVNKGNETLFTNDENDRGGFSMCLIRKDNHGLIAIATYYWKSSAIPADGTTVAQDILEHFLYWLAICEERQVHSVYFSYAEPGHEYLANEGLVRKTPQYEIVMEMDI